MITTPNMGLKRWDQPNDVFSYTELSDNFAALDTHDHTSGKGVQIPTAGIANLAVDNTKLAALAVTDAKVAASTITSAKLASPTHAYYRTLLQASGTFQGGQVVDTYLILNNQITRQAVNTASAAIMMPWTAAHYAVPNKTTNLRVAISGATNPTAPAITFTFGLYPVTAVSGGSGLISYTLGSVVASSTVAFASPAANTRVQGVSSDFAAPADGLYTLGVNITVSPAASHMSSWTALLQLHHV